MGITSGVNGDPNLYFTSPSTNSIGVYNPKTGGSVSQYPIPTVNANAENLAVGDSGAGNLVAGSDGNIYFLETAANQIGVFSPTLDKVIAEYPILSSDNAGLQAITSGPDGNIWFTESLQNKIGELNISTHVFTEFNVPTSLSDPYGITSDPADDAVWFTETNTNNVVEFNVQTHVFSNFNLGSSSLNPGNITYDSTNGNIYFVETQTASIGWLNAKNPTTAKSATGLQDTSINDQLDVDGSGNVSATSYTAFNISLLNISTGKITTNAYVGYFHGFTGGITLGSDGRLWVAEVASGVNDSPNIQPFTTAGLPGTTVSIPGTAATTPGAIVTDASGNLWFAELNSDYFTQIDSFSSTTEETNEYTFPSFTGQTQTSHVSALALDTQNQQVYFTVAGPGSNIIGEVNPTTGVITYLATLPSGADASGLTYDPMNGGYLWFTDEGLNKIGYMNPGGNAAEINNTPAGDRGPDAIVTDSSGNLWVSWSSSDTLDCFTPTGAGGWLPLPISLGATPEGMTYGPDGNIWVVESGQIQVINPSTQAIIRSISINGTGSITSQPEDNSVWVTTSTSVVSIATGTYALTTYPLPTTMGAPVAVVADETDNNVYFTAPGTRPANNSNYPNAIGVITLNAASQSDHLAIVTPPPANVTKGVGFGLVVGVDTSNNVLDGFLNTIDASVGEGTPNVDALGGTVTISLGANPNEDTLGGTLTEPVNEGVAIFSGLTLNNAGPGEVLSISYSGLSSVSSSPITVALAASKLAVEAQPPATVGAGQAFTVAFEAVDSNGNLDTSYNGPISVTTGVNPTGVSLGGTTVLGAINGIATFSTLTLAKLGPGYTIQGSDPNGILNPISSSAFTVTSGPAASIASTAGTSQIAEVGTAFGTALQATVEDQNGNPVSDVSVTFAAPASGAGGSFAGGGTTTVTTNSAGVATAPAFTANTVAGSYTVTATVAGVSAGASFSLSNMVGVASSITAAGGTPQSAMVGTTFATAFQAVVTDQYGNPVSGANVAFAAPASGAGGDFASGLPTTVTTDSAGVATAPAFVANTVAGSYTVTAMVAGVPAGATFRLSNTAGTASSIAATTGTPQSAVVGTTFTAAFQAVVKDQYGNPVSGANVTFTARASGVGGNFAGGVTATVTTNSAGAATAPAFTANTVAGDYTVTATATGVSTGATFRLSNTAGTASSITATAGNPQSTAIGTAFATAFQATVRDQYGNPVSGVSVTFAAPASGSGGSFAGGVTTTVTTNSAGVATAPGFTASTVVGSYTVTATVGDVSAGANFSLSNVLLVSSLTAVSGTGTYAGTGTLTATLTADGSGLADESVDLILDNNGIITALGPVITNSDGVATLNGVSLAGFDAGTTIGAVGASFAGDSTYASSSNSGDLTINRASATLSLTGLTTTYDAASQAANVITTPASLTGLLVTYTQNGTPVAAPVTAGSYVVTATLSNTNYTATPVTGTLVIGMATPTITWANPAAILYGTALSGTQLDATASVPGNFKYNPGMGTVLNVGNGETLSATFIPTDTTDYNTVTTTVTINVVPAPVVTINVAPSPLVTVTSLQPTTVRISTGTGKRKKTKTESGLLLQFNGALSGTGNPAAYQFLTGKTKKHVTTYSKPVRLTVYSSTPTTVILLPAGKLNASQPEELKVTAADLIDAFGRPLNGGQNFTATFGTRVVTSVRARIQS